MLRVVDVPATKVRPKVIIVKTNVLVDTFGVVNLEVSVGDIHPQVS